MREAMNLSTANFNETTSSVFQHSSYRARIVGNALKDLDADRDRTKSRYQEDETRSFRSAARSLSIVDGASKQSRVNVVKASKELAVSPEKNDFFTKNNDALG